MIQIVEQSHEEKLEIYMKLTKKELIEMLIECNRQLDAAIKNCTIPLVAKRYSNMALVGHRKQPGLNRSINLKNIVRWKKVKHIK